MYRPMTGEEREMLQTMVDDIYHQFVQTVADGRHMDEERVKSIADGRILTGRQAQDLGLVDAMGNYYDALNYAASSGGLDVDHIETRSYTNSAVTLRSLLRSEAARLSNVMGESMAGSMKKALTEGENPTIK